jgi:hypothetical protein
MAATFAKKTDRAGAILCLTLTVVSCDSPVSPPPNVVVTVTPVLAGSFASLGGAHAFVATATDTLDNPIDTLTFAWSIFPQTSHVTITSEGIVTVGTAAAARDYSIRATAGGVTAGATLRVLPRPEGMLVFSSNVGGNGHLFVKNFDDDQDAVQITTTGTGTIAGIGVDHTTLAVFFGRGALPNSDIYRINLDGSNLVNLTNDIASQNQGPAVNLATHEVFFSRRIATASQIFRMNPDGSGLAQVTTGTQSKVLPSVSPDGQWLAWGESFQPGFNQEIVTAAIDGSNPVRFTTRAGIDASPAWESSSRLYWSGDAGGVNFDIFAADAPGGGNLVDLTPVSSSDVGVSRGCAPNTFTFLRGSEAHHFDVATGLAVKYTLVTPRNMTFARRLCP